MPLGKKTSCEASSFGISENVVNSVCVACPVGGTISGDHSASGIDAWCDATSGGASEKVSHVYTACSAGRTSSGKHGDSGIGTLLRRYNLL